MEKKVYLYHYSEGKWQIRKRRKEKGKIRKKISRKRRIS
jgi:hypothetical protein